MPEYSCCFIGHRKIEITDELISRLRYEIENLYQSGVRRFLFGSRSDFNWLCFDIVKELQKEHSDIVCVAYNTKNEDFAYGGDTRFNEVYKPESMYVSGKASYVERNQIMIDNSDVCIFYYNKEYEPKQRLISDKSVTGIWTSKQSGTALAYEYAVKKKKRIINVFS